MRHQVVCCIAQTGTSMWVNGNGSKEMGRIGLLCHGSNLHRFGIGSNGIGSTLKNAKFKGDNILISTQVHSTQFDLSQFDLSYSTKRVDLILFDLFHSTHFMQSHQCAASKIVCAMSSGRYLNLRGRGSSCDRSRLARRMSNLDAPHCRQPSKVLLRLCLTQSLRENVSAIVTTCNKLQINRLILHCLPHIGHPCCKVFRL